MKCPHLRNSPPKCIRMIERGLDGNVSDFDIEHYCDGNPINCYFYRVLSSQKTESYRQQKFSVIKH